MLSANSWSQRTTDSIIRQVDAGGFHPELQKRWAYVPGMVMMAIARTGEFYGNDAYFEFMKKHMDLFVQEDGSIRTYRVEEYNLDQINQGKNLFTLIANTGQHKYEQAAHLLAAQLAGHPRTSEGGFWHKKVYPFQMWLDGLYMASPFLAQYAKTYHKPELLDEVALQLLLIEQKTRDPKTGLLYHGWDEAIEQIWADSKTGCSANFWGRALGWYAMALVDALEHFPINHPKRGTIIGIYERLCHAICRVQDEETGLWYQVLDQGGRKGNYLEASGSAMFIYSMAKGTRLGYLEKHFQAKAKKGYEGMIERMITEDDDGVHVHSINQGSGLSLDRDGSYGYYIRENVGSDFHIGVAPFLLASLEIEKLFID